MGRVVSSYFAKMLLMFRLTDAVCVCERSRVYKMVVFPQVWDKDLLGSNTHVAGCRFPMSSVPQVRGSAARVPVPRWYQVRERARY